MKYVKVSTNGRVPLPAGLQKKYKLTLGRRVKFEAVEDGIRIISLVTPDEIKANIGFLGKKGKLLKALMEEKKAERKL